MMEILVLIIFFHHFDDRESWYDRENTILRHRLDGPAIEYKSSSSSNQWWYKGKRINCTTQKEFERKIKLLIFL